MKLTYEEFLKKKVRLAEKLGFDIQLDEINPILKPHQKDIVKWMVSMGRAACFASFGLGKSIIQLETVRLTLKNCGGKGLIVIPLGVRQEFFHDAEMLGIDIKFIRRNSEADSDGIYLTNYESVRDGKLDPREFNVASLDEASCFPAGTMIDTPLGSKKIDNLRVGDKIFNASGVDEITDIFQRKVSRVVRINVNNKRIYCSDNHKFFTINGWVRADELQEGDSIMETAEAMLLVSEDNHSEEVTGSKEKILQSILLGEMAYESTGKQEEELGICKEENERSSYEEEDFGEAIKTNRVKSMRMVRDSIHTTIHSNEESEVLRKFMLCKMANEQRSQKRNSEELPSLTGRKAEESKKNKRILESGYSGSKCQKERNSIEEHDARSIHCAESIEKIEGQNISIKGREQQNHGTSEINVHCIGESPNGARNQHGSNKKSLQERPELLQSGYSLSIEKDSHRSGREFPSIQEMEIPGSQENRDIRSSRVDSVEILEQGSNELDRFRNAEGELYFYDITAKRHPSFSVEGLLVHNCLRGFGGTKTFREFMALFAGDRKTMDNRILGESIKYRFVATATPSPNEYIELLAYSAFLGVMDVGGAKAQPLDAKILTPDGWVLMGDIKPGSRVIAVDGSVTNVIATYPQGEKEIFRVTFSDGASTEATSDHLWLTKTLYERNNERRYFQRNPKGERDFATVKTTAQIAEHIVVKGGLNHSVPIVSAIDFPRKNLPIHPWLLGALIGDACLRESSVTFSTGDEWMRERVCNLLPEGLFLRETCDSSGDYTITSTGKQGGRGPKSNKILSDLRLHGLLGKRSFEKVIPNDYLMSSIQDRMDLLRGLMDTDGSVSKEDGAATFCTTSPHLVKQVIDLVRSLGGLATSRKVSACDLTRHTAYVIVIKTDFCPFSLPRKVSLFKSVGVRAMTRYITNIESVCYKKAQCIAIDHPSRLYVTDDYIVTHNTRFFKRDSTKADKLTLHAHKEKEFWLWVASWGLFVQKPSDLGHSDEGYELPEMEIHWHEIASDDSDPGYDFKGQKLMFKEQAIGIVESAKEKRESLDKRIQKMMEIRSIDPDAHRIIWHDLEVERHAIKKAVPSIAVVYGSQDDETKASNVIGFSNGEIQELAGKPVMLGSGCNFQRHCNWAIFLGIGFKFNDFIQAVHRLYRFLQTKKVRIDLIYTESEREVKRILEEKWAKHKHTVGKMTEIIKEYGLSNAAMAESLHRSMGVERVEVVGRDFTVVNNDCVQETQRMPDNSVDLILTSIPFSTQYEYSPNYADFGHTDNNSHFFEQLDYLTPNMLRVLKPGRIAVIHVKDRIVPGGLTGLGYQTVYPFHAKAIEHYQQHGFGYMGMITVVTDVVRENNQTYRLGWSEVCKDSSKISCGMPEYLLIFRKTPTDTSNSYADDPIKKTKESYTRSRWQVDAHGFWRSSGNRLMNPEELLMMEHDQIFKWFRDYNLGKVYDYEQHVNVGETLDNAGKLPVDFMLLQPPSWLPDVWTDVARMRTLNMIQKQKGKEMHLCPLPFDIADRIIERFSNPGELVLDPFSGIGSVGYRALLKGRKYFGIELSPTYFTDSCFYLNAAEKEMSTPDLFGMEKIA